MTDHSTPRWRGRITALAVLGLAAAGLSAPAAASAQDQNGTADPVRAVYVEVNSNDLANVADYTLEGTDRPAFDMAMIFAANINYDTTKQQAYLYLNDRSPVRCRMPRLRSGRCRSAAPRCCCRCSATTRAPASRTSPRARARRRSPTSWRMP